ncbi:hypothetical protein [Aquibium oceanicum]|uniref:Uncharacterized protein n=1 Tax=Aquibium oceanicum TaxID=1670800 RepID=A0A1L3SP24_9HYPH|nr:hypothetical protein [Aquibium oceanicum]APH71130.1 hypothetical protein BSQ44_06920 [Aquibium oceanicum]
MAGFVESATLLVKDRSSSNIRKVNRELEKLFTTAKKLQRGGNLLGKLGLDDREIKKAKSAVRDLEREFTRLSRTRARPLVDIRGIQSARAEVRNLEQELARLSGRRAAPRVDIAGANAARTEVRALERMLIRMAGKKSSALVDVTGIASAVADLRRVDSLLRRLSGREAQVRVKLLGESTARGNLNGFLATMTRLESNPVNIKSDTTGIKAFIAEVRAAERALKRLNKLTAVKTSVPSVGTGGAQTRMERLQQEIRETDALLNSLGRNVDISGLNRMAAELRKMRRDAEAIRSALSGAGARIATGGGADGAGARRPGARSEGGFAPVMGSNTWDLAKSIIVGSAIFNVTNATFQGFKEAAAATDISDLKVQLLTVEQQTLMKERLEGRDMTGRFMTRAARDQAVADIVPQIQGTDEQRMTSAIKLVDRIDDLLVGLRSTGEFGTDQAGSIGRAIQSAAGELVDAQTGEFTADTQKIFRALEMSVIAMGEKFDPEKIGTALAFSKTAGRTLDDQGLAAMFSIVADKGMRAANSMNSLITNLSGNQSKEANKALAALELRKGGKTVAEDDLRRNPPQWIATHLVPALEKAAGKSVSEMDPAELASRLQPFIGRENSRDMALELIEGFGPLTAFFEQFAAADPFDPMKIAARNATSSLVALDEAGKRISDLFGTISSKLEGPFIESLNNIATTAQSIDALLRGDTLPEGAADAALGVGKDAALVGIGALLLKGVLNALNPLNVSAAALDGSAVALTGAARMLMAAAAAQGLRAGKGGLDDAVNEAADDIMDQITDQSGSSRRDRTPRVRMPSSGLGITNSFIGLLNILSWGETIVSDFGKSTEQMLAEIQANTQRSKELNERLESMLPQSFVDLLHGGVEATPQGVGQGFKELFAKQVESEPITPTDFDAGMATLKAELAAINEKIRAAKEAEKIPGSSDAQVQALETQKLSIEAQIAAWDAQLKVSADDITNSIATGGVQAAASLDQTASTMGPVIGAAIASFAPGIGTAIGQAAAAIINQAAVNIKVQQQPTNTGAVNIVD